MKVKSLSRVQLLAAPWTAAYQAPLSMGFSRQEYWSGVPLPSPEVLSTSPECCFSVSQVGFCLRNTNWRTPRLISEDKSTGKGLYRIWIALRLPKFLKEDFVKYHDNVYQVSDVDGNRIQVINLENQDTIALKWREYDSIEKIEHLEGIQKAIITAKSPSMMQILDPDDYSPIDLDCSHLDQESASCLIQMTTVQSIWK